MNDQAIAIVNGAIAQLQALSASQQAQIDADSADVATAQAKLDADNADIATASANKASTDSITASLQSLIPATTPVPAPAA